MTTQQDCSIGISPAESTYGTNTTVTRWFEFTDESLDYTPTFVQGEGLRVAGTVPRSARRSTGQLMGEGDFTLEATSKSMGILFKAALGTSTTTLISGSAYQQVHTPQTTDYLASYTLQKGIPPLGGGTTHAMTYPGAVCGQLEFDCPNSGIVTVKTTWNSKSFTTATSYAAPSYGTPLELFTFVKGAITIGGSVTAPTTTALATGGTSVADIVDFNVVWSNNLDDGGFNIGGAGTRSRAPAKGIPSLTGHLTAEYDAVTLRDAFVNQTDLALVLTLTGNTNLISGSIYPTLQLYIPNIRLEGEIPNANSGGVIQQSIDFTGLDNLTAASPFYVVYISADTAF